MGILLSCCFKGGLDDLTGALGSKSKSRKTAMTSLLADKNSGQVDGRKVSSPPANYGAEECCDRYTMGPGGGGGGGPYQQDSPSSETSSIRSGKVGHAFGAVGASWSTGGGSVGTGGGLFRSKTAEKQHRGRASPPTSFGANYHGQQLH